MIRYRRRLARVIESWFELPGDTRGADLLECLQLPAPIPGGQSSEFRTRILPLTLSLDQLLSGIDRDTRRDIRRAEDRDAFLTEAMPASGSALDDFFVFYDRFAAAKGLRKSDRTRLIKLAEGQALALSRCRAAAGEILVAHAYVVCAGRARLLLSASTAGADSELRKMIGRANRLLHWRDIVRFKEERVDLYDLGGWSGASDPALARIDHFKAEFGGEIVVEYNFRGALSPLGSLVLGMGRLLHR